MSSETSVERQRRELGEELRDVRYQRKEISDELADLLQRQSENQGVLENLGAFVQNILEACGPDAPLLRARHAEAQPEDVAAIVRDGQYSRFPQLPDETGAN
jgi:hypothetical protein